jgi:hypothetical protein
MRHKNSVLHAVSKYLGSGSYVMAALLLVGNAAWADNNSGGFKREVKNDRAVRLLETVRIPPVLPAANKTAGALYSFDISWIDEATRTYYLADRSNAAVDIVDTTSDILIAQLTPAPLAPFAGFTGATSTSGPNGVTTSGHCLFVTDSPSRIVSFNASVFPPAPVSSVNTDPVDPTRADELAVDPGDSLILAINNTPTPPYGTFIKFDPASCTLTKPDPTVDRVTFTMATNGAEQPIWDPGTKKFYLSIPQIGSVAESGGVVRIDPTTKKVDQTYGVMFCSPAGLTKGPNNDALIGCNTVFDTVGKPWNAIDTNTAAPIQVILNVKTGNQSVVAGVGVGDEVWYNKGDNNYYTASSTSPLRPLDTVPSPPVPPLTAQGAAILGVIDAKDQEVLQLVPTFNTPQVPPPPGTPIVRPAGTAHSVAADAKNNHIFVPLPANNVFPNCLTGCIAVYWHGDEDNPGQVALP